MNVSDFIGMNTLNTSYIEIDEFLELSNILSGEKWLYQQKEWLNVVLNGLNLRVFGLKTESIQDGLIAVTPVMERRKLFMTLVGSPIRGSYTEFSGPVFADEVSFKNKQRAIISQHEFLKSRGASYIEWGCKNDSDGCFNVLAELDCKCLINETFILNLDHNTDKTWNKFKGRARNTVRKAEKNGVTVRNVDNPSVDDISEYYGMLQETFNRQGVKAPHPKIFFEELFGQLSPIGWVKLFIASHNDKVLAGAIFLMYEGRMMYLSGTSKPEGGRLGANNLIQWEAIKFASKNGVIEYDMGGAGNAAIDKYKRSFGGNDFHHQRWVYRTWIAKLAESLYTFMVKRGWMRING
jgi:CelD/BcsL family acetyltransferase involved in cellulose biosynthesis